MYPDTFNAISPIDPASQISRRNPMATMTFFGAAGTVTGSCHLLSSGDERYLLDCGQFQGPWEIEKLNYDPLPPVDQGISGLILSHGHLDHCGRIPVLTRNGFTGSIYCTPPTRDIARLILLDSAHVQKEEYDWKRRRLTRSGIEVASPLYTTEDAYYCLDRFDRTIRYGETIRLSQKMDLTFHASNAGHILGAAQITIDYPGENGKKRRLLFTGDIGDGGRPVVPDPDRPERPVDVLLMEATYGDREHRSYEASVREFEETILETIRKKGTVLIPSYALERTQEVLFHLKKMHEKGIMTSDVPVFLNSPLAIDITRLYHRHCSFCRKSLAGVMKRGGSPFVFPGLHLTETVEESQAIHHVPDPKIIIAGSGMMTGGRIKHHLKHHLWRDTTSLVIVGYQAQGTLGRKIVDGADTVRIFGETVAVRARIHTINGFSAHAGRRSLVEFARQADPELVILVHGEQKALSGLAAAIEKEIPRARILVPKLGDKVRI